MLTKGSTASESMLGRRVIAPIEETSRGGEDREDSHGDQDEKAPGGSADGMVARYRAP